MHSDMLGFLNCLQQAETLLLSGVSREDRKLVELDSVLERHPRTCTKALVRLSIDTFPEDLGMHFLDDIVPLHSRLTDNKAAGQTMPL
jgi:hypothetical protein